MPNNKEFTESGQRYQGRLLDYLQFKVNNLSETRVDASVATTYDIDWNSANTAFRLTMTANTTFSDINLPTGTKTKVIEIIISGNFVPTFPGYWEGEPGNDAYNGAVRNRLLVSCLQGDSGSEDVIYTLTNLAT